MEFNRPRSAGSRTADAGPDGGRRAADAGRRTPGRAADAGSAVPAADAGSGGGRRVGRARRGRRVGRDGRGLVAEVDDGGDRAAAVRALMGRRHRDEHGRVAGHRRGDPADAGLDLPVPVHV
jgi:hypothetical protein